MLRETDERMAAARPREGCPDFAVGRVLAELLSDPMTQQLMAADRVERRELEALLLRMRFKP